MMAFLVVGKKKKKGKNIESERIRAPKIIHIPWRVIQE